MESPTGTRLDILKYLLRHELSSQVLADKLGVSPAAIRQHLTMLEALRLVTRRRIVTQPSRPTYLYRVSPQGMRVFPKRYDLLLTQLIEVITERQGPDGAGAIIEAAARRVAERVPARVTRADGQDRWQRLIEWLEAEFSWHADVSEEAGDARRLTVHQCPFQDLSKTQPDVCGLFFGTLIRSVCGGVTVEHAGVAALPACCAFVVRLAPPEPPAA
jgi:DeoR family transcriptional regulator, suf operon transcriptional repressor